jgi:restriction system protein
VVSAWQVRAGRSGERDHEALTAGRAILGWESVPDLAGYETREELRHDLQHRYPGGSVHVAANWTSQLWRFSHEMAVGDLVVMPVKTQGGYAIGRVTGPYRHVVEADTGFRHTRPVSWLRTDVDRDEFGWDLRRSLTSMLTVCRLTRHQAPVRIGKLARHLPDPGYDVGE